MNRLFTRGAVVLVAWGGINACLAAVLFAFGSRSSLQERAMYFSSAGLVELLAVLFLVFPAKPRADVAGPRGGGQVRNGAPAAALAAACLAGGLAWVFGVFMAYFALPLIAFCLARWRAEWAVRRKEQS
jgi:hypothetical protein